VLLTPTAFGASCVAEGAPALEPVKAEKVVSSAPVEKPFHEQIFGALGMPSVVAPTRGGAGDLLSGSFSPLSRFDQVDLSPHANHRNGEERTALPLPFHA